MEIARSAAFSDIEELAGNLQVADILELAASSGRAPSVCLREALIKSRAAWTIDKDNKPVGMFGVATYPTDPQIGIPWLLASNEIRTFPRKFLRGSKGFIKLMQSWYPVLTNYVDLRHTDAQRWLEWNGFVKHRVIPRYGVGQIPFIQYVRYR